MPNILIRDLAPSVHSALQRRAERRGQSLQQYLSAELERLALRPSVDEVLEQISTRTGGQVGFEQAMAHLAASRGAE